MGSLFDVKNFWKKFFDDAYFSEPKNSGEKFFAMPTLEERFLSGENGKE